MRACPRSVARTVVIPISLRRLLITFIETWSSSRINAVVAAGRGILDVLPPAGAKPTKFTAFFIGNPKGAKLSFSAPPTVLE